MSSVRVSVASDPAAPADLRLLLDRLQQAAQPSEGREFDEIRSRLSAPRLRVLVAGEAKRGKSTLINRLVGRDLLPSGVLPLTAVATTVRFAPAGADAVDVRLADGRHERRGLNALPELVTEAGNPHNRAGVAEVVVTVVGGALAGHRLELVDTPGVGSVHEHNTLVARDVYAGLDAVIVVLGVDPPITAAERDLLVELSGRAVVTFVVLNKADRLTQDEVAEAVEFTREVAESVDLHVPVWAVSARQRDQGFQSFQAAFLRYVEERGESDAERALRGHVRRLAESLRDDLLLSRRAFDVDDVEQRERLHEFGRRLAFLERQARELDDRLPVAERRLRRELGAAADAMIRTTTAHATLAVREHLAALPGDADAGQIETAGRAAVVNVVSSAVARWREEQAERLTGELAEDVERIDEERRTQVEALRGAARDLLDLDLALTGGSLRLAEGRPFWFAFDQPPSWQLPGTELIRRHGPGAAGRARRRVVEQIPMMVDKQVGRARSDLQERLAEAARKVGSDLRRGHMDLLERLSSVLTEAEQDEAMSASERGHRRREMDRRADLVDEVLADLAQARIS